MLGDKGNLFFVASIGQKVSKKKKRKFPSNKKILSIVKRNLCWSPAFVRTSIEREFLVRKTKESVARLTLFLDQEWSLEDFNGLIYSINAVVGAVNLSFPKPCSKPLVKLVRIHYASPGEIVFEVIGAVNSLALCYCTIEEMCRIFCFGKKVFEKLKKIRQAISFSKDEEEKTKRVLDEVTSSDAADTIRSLMESGKVPGAKIEITFKISHSSDFCPDKGKGKAKDTQ